LPDERRLDRRCAVRYDSVMPDVSWRHHGDARRCVRSAADALSGRSREDMAGIAQTELAPVVGYLADQRFHASTRRSCWSAVSSTSTALDCNRCNSDRRSRTASAMSSTPPPPDGATYTSGLRMSPFSRIASTVTDAENPATPPYVVQCRLSRH